MSRLDGSSSRSRPRANTTNAFLWRRGREPSPSPSQFPSQPTLTVEELIQALGPPAVPSLAHARQLASLLSNASPLPPVSKLNGVFSALCGSDIPIPFQAAGFDILSAYFENAEAPSLTTGDRLVYFSLFRSGDSRYWSADLWEPRFKAFRSFSKWGSDLLSIEGQVVELFQGWVQAAFVGLLDGEDSVHRRERERCVEILSEFLRALMCREEILSRLEQEKITQVLRFHANLIYTAGGRLSSPTPDTSRPSYTHKRHPSSMSLSSSSLPDQPVAKTPFAIAVGLYINYLKAQGKTLPPETLSTVFPPLFYALAVSASPLPKLALSIATKDSDQQQETKIAEFIYSLLDGPHATAALIIVRKALYPQADAQTDKCSLGAHRALRLYIRRALQTRIARAYLSRETSTGYTHTGAPGHMDLSSQVLAQAWPRDGGTTWDAARIGKDLAKSVGAWARGKEGHSQEIVERVLLEVVGTLRDILRELAENESIFTDEEAWTFGQSLYNLASYVTTLSPGYTLPLSSPSSASTPILIALSSLLAEANQDISLLTKIQPSLPDIFLSIATHLADEDTARIPEAFNLYPTNHEWLDHWKTFFGAETLFIDRPTTRKTILRKLAGTYNHLREMKNYRRPLAGVVYDFCEKTHTRQFAIGHIAGLWQMLADEAVIRVCAADENDEEGAIKIVTLLTKAAKPTPGSLHDHDTSIAPSRNGSEFNTSRETTSMPILTSILSSLNLPSTHSPSIFGPGTPSGLHSTPIPPVQDPADAGSPDGASALVSVFAQIAFGTPPPGKDQGASIRLALSVWDTLADLLQCTSPDFLQQNISSAGRLRILQFVMRLRADRDHRLYWQLKGFDADGQIHNLCNMIGRAVPPENLSTERRVIPDLDQVEPVRSARKASRGRPNKASASASALGSRSRSRVSEPFRPEPPVAPYISLWSFADAIPDVLGELSDTLSERLQSYDPEGPDEHKVLPVSRYLSALCSILQHETDPEVISYVLCHLPVQLSNKHLFCGPKSRAVIGEMVITIGRRIATGNFTASWPISLRTRDAQSLPYHALCVLISYKQSLDGTTRHLLVETLQAGLDSSLSTATVCLQSLTMCAYELEVNLTRYLSGILEKLSQIMSNLDMAVYILGFLSVVGSRKRLHANFRETDFKMVFGVATQYLQQHNRMTLEWDEALSWALAQHVRILSFHLLYVWFLAVKLQDRPRHIPYITKQLLLANEGKGEIDDYTEVCFDWLSRYTYASADPRPASSLLSDMVTGGEGTEDPINVKSWIYGNAVLTVRALPKLGWFEVLSRRPSGFVKFLCRLENAPMVGPGDVDPDMVTTAASLLMQRNLPNVTEENQDTLVHDLVIINSEDTEMPTVPDPMTGYVWSGTAPSQRRKDVAIAPAFLPLQLSAYPQPLPANIVIPPDSLPRWTRTFDRAPVIDTHKVGILYVAPGQTDEVEILRNTHGSPAYTHFLSGLGRLIELQGQVDVYAGGLDPGEDGKYAYAWWDDIGQILFHTATMMPTLSSEIDPFCSYKKKHLGNDYVRIVWNDSGLPYRFETLKTQFQYVNVVIEPHSAGAIAAFSKSQHENEYFKVTVQRKQHMEFSPIGEYKLISAESLPDLVRQLSLLGDWFAGIFFRTAEDTEKVETTTNWQTRLTMIRQLKATVLAAKGESQSQGEVRDFTGYF